MHIKNSIILLILICFTAGRIFSEEILIGGPEGWDKFHRMETAVAGREGLLHMQLADSEYLPGGDVELLLHFNRGIYDAAGQYSVKQNTGVTLSGASPMKGAGTGAFSGDAFLELIPDRNAAFAAGSGRLNDFSIEFWLSPARLSEGETIIRWNGAAGEQPLRQEIICAISNRNLFWELNNIFLTPELGATAFRLESVRSLIPKRWHHHMLRYDSSTGLLEYLIDGIPEDIVYTSRGGTEEQEIFHPFIGEAKPASLVVGRGFTGFIDELRITTAFSEPDLFKYGMNSGTAVSQILDLGYYDSRFSELKTDEVLSGQTRIYYYYRMSNEYFQPDSEYPGWNQIEAGELLSPDVKGRYLQVMAELFPDGTAAVSPELHRLAVSYSRNLPPMPPAYLSGRARDGKVELSWQPVTDADIAGYRLYYGSRPGLYFGTDAGAGDSPVDAGNTTTIEIDGLTNGKLYYFAVTSYDNAEIPHESVFSREISIRPSAIIRNE